MAISVLQQIILSVVCFNIAYLIVAHLLTWYYFGHYDRLYSSPKEAPPVSIIKPIKGLDARAEENFRSFCVQDYPNAYEILFCVEDRHDPAVPVVERIIDEFRDRDLRLVFNDPGGTPSFGKVRKMIAGLAQSRHEVIVFSNADVQVSSTFLKEAAASAGNAEIGLAATTSIYHGAEDWGAACWNVSVTTFLLRMAPAALLGLLNVVDGKTMVIRKQVIAEIGGLEQFGLDATDDIPLARAISRRGYRIHLLKQPARVFHPHDSFAGYWWHWHRWLVIIRHYLATPVWCLAFLQLPLWWSLVYTAIALSHGDGAYLGTALITAVLVGDLISTSVINMKFLHDRTVWRFIWVVPISRVVALPLLIHSCLTNEVLWRGARLRVNSDCTLSARDAGSRM
jgi:ceramide glucosyltransferase